MGVYPGYGNDSGLCAHGIIPNLFHATSHPSCSFAPPSLDITSGSGPVTDTLTISTATQTTALFADPKSGTKARGDLAAAVTDTNARAVPCIRCPRTPQMSTSHRMIKDIVLCEKRVSHYSAPASAEIFWKIALYREVWPLACSGLYCYFYSATATRWLVNRPVRSQPMSAWW